MHDQSKISTALNESHLKWAIVLMKTGPLTGKLNQLGPICLLRGLDYIQELRDTSHLSSLNGRYMALFNSLKTLRGEKKMRFELSDIFIIVAV